MARTTSQTRTTTNRAEIRRWVESKGGCPAHVKGTGRGKDPGVLRVDFPGYSGVETLERLSWDDWFKAFDKNGLAFIYQPSTRFSKLVARATAVMAGNRRATPRRATGAKRATTAKRSAAKRTTKKPSTRSTAQRRTATTSRGTVKRSTTVKRGATKRPTKRTSTTKRTTKRTGAAKR